MFRRIIRNEELWWVDSAECNSEQFIWTATILSSPNEFCYVCIVAVRCSIREVYGVYGFWLLKHRAFGSIVTWNEIVYACFVCFRAVLCIWAEVAGWFPFQDHLPDVQKDLNL